MCLISFYEIRRYIQQKNTAEPLYKVFKPEKEQQTIPMFSKLFEILPDAEDLLNLEPEELAGPLLVSLENRDEIIPEGIIGYDNMRWEIEEGSSRENPNLNYPYEHREEVLFALMEAWQCLVCERFVAPIPTNLARVRSARTYTIYFVTRRAKKIETLEDFEAYRKADLLRKHQLHRIIAEKVWSIFVQGSYGTAVLEAFRQVEIAVRKAGGYAEKDYGVPLMRQAFDKNDGKLTDQSQPEPVREAKAHLFAGAIGLYKNPSSHHDVEFAPEEAAKIIIFASHLLQIVDSCQQLNPNSSI